MLSLVIIGCLPQETDTDVGMLLVKVVLCRLEKFSDMKDISQASN